MTARSPSSDELARVAACAHVVADKGADSRYVADCVVRAYQGRHLAEFCRDIGWRCDEQTVAVIASGVGALTMRWTGNAVDRPIAPSIIAGPEPRAADDDECERRLAICRRCRDWSGDRCRIAGCRCAGLARPEHRFSRCPVGQW